MSRGPSIGFRKKIGVHLFTRMDVARVRQGVANARCKACSPYMRQFSDGHPARPNCTECEKSRVRLGVLEAYMEKEGML